MQESINDKNKKINIEIYGMNIGAFMLVSLVILVATFTNNLPSGMVGALAIMIVLGGIFNIVGNKTPIVKTYLGGGAIVCIFASAAMVTFDLIPTEVIDNVKFFMNDVGFLNFYIAALIWRRCNSLYICICCYGNI